MGEALDKGRGGYRHYNVGGGKKRGAWIKEGERGQFKGGKEGGINNTESVETG